MKTTIEITGTPNDTDLTKERVVHCMFGIAGIGSFRFVWILAPGREWDDDEKARALQAVLHTQRYTLDRLFDLSVFEQLRESRAETQQWIAEVLVERGESLLNDEGVDRDVAEEIAREIINGL